MVRHSAARDELAASQRTSSIDGSTTRPPLIHVAARFDRCEILDWLCGEMSREEIGIDCGDSHSNTPVHVAARYGHLRSIQVSFDVLISRVFVHQKFGRFPSR